MAEQQNTINSGTVEGLSAFIDYLMEKGYALDSAVVPWKSAAKQVFSTMEGEDYGGFDVRTFDLDEYMGRFENRARGKYKQESLAAYRSRLRKAVEAYRSFLRDGSLPTFRGSVRRARGNGDAAGRGSGSGGPTAPTPGQQAPPPPNPELVAYPFPLRSGQMAHLNLPPRLEKADADRMAAFLQTLVFEPQHALPPGEEPS